MLKLFTSEQTNVQAKEIGTEFIQLRYGFECINLEADKVTGLTIEEVFTAHAGALGVKADRLANYRSGGNIVPGSTVVEPGACYSAAVNSESKGL